MTHDATGGKEIVPALAGYHIYVHGYDLRAMGTAMNVRLVSNPGAANQKYLIAPEYLAANDNVKRGWDYPGYKAPLGHSVGIRTSVAGRLYAHIRACYSLV